MKKIIGIILIIVGSYGLIGLFVNPIKKPEEFQNKKYEIYQTEHSFGNFSYWANQGKNSAYYIGRLSPILFLVIGFILIRKKIKFTDKGG